MADETGPDQIRNHLSGKANNVVQAGHLHGDVNFNEVAPNPHDLALRYLASAVQNHWHEEVARRGLLDPAPLAVSWLKTGEPIADHASNINGSFSGCADDLTGLARSFRNLPRRRLVLLGDGGAGKTTLAILLVVALLKDAEPREPIPVMVSIGSWDPQKEHLHTWLVRRLEEDYPGIRRLGRKTLENLVSGRHIIPVLDGLDEAPKNQQASILTMLNRSLTVDDPLVLTCRTQEYVAAVHGGDVLSAAAIVRAEPVEAEAAVAYLHAGTPPFLAHQWKPVFDQIRTGNGPLAEAFRSPLTISLARTIYGRSISSPAELLDTRRFSTGWAVEYFLLGAVVPSSYEDYLVPATPSPNPTKNQYEPGKVAKWSTFLARHLYWLNTRDFAWWQLKYAVPRFVFALAGWLLSVFIFLPFLALAMADENARSSSIEDLFATCMVFAAILLTWSAIRSRRPKSPYRILVHPSRGFMAAKIYLLRGLARIVLAVVILSVLLATLGWLFPLWGFMLLNLVMLFVASILPMAYILPLPRRVKRCVSWPIRKIWSLATRGIWGHVSDFGVTNPRRLLQSDRSVALLVLCAFPIATSVIPGLIWIGAAIESSNNSGASWGQPGGYAPLLMFPMLGAVVGTAFVVDSAWWNFVVARLWLGIRGRLPLRLMRFLEDGRERQVFRQSGTMYQFRHARLHDRLLYG